MNSQDCETKAQEDIEYLLRNQTKVFTEALPKYFSSLFGDGIRPGWIHNLHIRLIRDNQDIEAWNDLEKLSKILGPEGKIAKTVFSDFSTNLVLEKYQLPVSTAEIFFEKQRSGILTDYEITISKGKRTFDFKNSRVNVSLQQWFLFILVNAALNQPYIETNYHSQSLDDFYFNQTTNPYLHLIRKYLIFFNKSGSVNQLKLLFILKQYCLQDYTLFLESKTTFPPVPKQIILDIVYLLLYFDRSSLNKEQMIGFFSYYLNSLNRGSQAFDACSLTRLWLFYIRPFDTVEASVINLILETDYEPFQNKRTVLSLKRYEPQSILCSNTLLNQYYDQIRNNLQSYVQILHLALNSIFNNKSARSIYILSLISCLFNPNFESSIIRMIQTFTGKIYNFLENRYYIEAKHSLTRVFMQLECQTKTQSYFLRQQITDESRKFYEQNQRQIGEFLSLYDVSGYVEQEKSVKSQIIQEHAKSIEVVNPWSAQFCSHEIRIAYYIALLIANIFDLLVHNRQFSWNPQTNLRFACNISVVLIVLSVSLVLSYVLF